MGQPADQGHADTLAATPSPSSSSSSGAPRPVAVASTALDDANAARYQHSKSIGRGGMGEVLLAEDQRIGRQVAVKTLREHARDPGSTARFLREARVQGQLEHPAIVPVYDLGAGADGSPFFTMKRLRGMTLEQLLAALIAGDREITRVWSQRKLLTAFAQACQAVHFAHTRGVVHRDLKPSNIMLGDFGEIYVLDWGIARVAGVADDSVPAISTGETESERTAYGSVIGTPGYMAPEQLRGETDQVDARSDVYALGAILFEILTLKTLHDRTSRDSILRSTLEGVDARAAVRAPDRDVVPELEAICVRASALDPAARYPDVADLVDELERYLDGDRDLERRRQLAAEHAAAAMTAAEHANTTGDEVSRKRALRDAGRALALDAGNDDAIAVMTQLFVQPPVRIPDEVEEALRRAEQRSSNRTAVLGAMVYLGVLSFAPLYLVMGVLSWPYFFAIGGLAVVMAVQAYRSGTSGNVTFATVQVAIVGFAVLLVLVSRAIGPFIAVPSMAALGTAFFLLHGRLQYTPFTIALGCAAVTVPVILEYLGVFGRTFVVTGDTLVIRSELLHMPPTLSVVVLLAVSVVTVVVGALFMVDVRHNQQAAARQLQLQAWQLRQLVPERTHAVVTAPARVPDSGACSVIPAP